MRSHVIYLFSGISNAGATGTLSVIGTDRFTFSMESRAFVGSTPSTGKIDIQGRIDDGAPYVNLYSLTTAENSGVLFNYEYPLESVRAILNDNTPSPTGIFTVAVRLAAIRD